MYYASIFKLLELLYECNYKTKEIIPTEKGHFWIVDIYTYTLLDTNVEM